MAGSRFWQRLEIILSSQLGPKHRMVLIALWKFCGDDDHCWPKQKALAAAVGVSIRALQRLISDLRDAGIVTAERGLHLMTYRVDWSAIEAAGKVKAKRLNKKPSDDPIPATSDTSIPAETDGNGHCHSRRNCRVIPAETDVISPPELAGMSSYRNSIETPMKLQGENPESFKAICEQIYQAYPKHVGKANAIKAIGKVLKRPETHELAVTADELLAAVEEFSRATEGANLQFVPYPASWFNAGSWEDDRAIWQTIGRDKANGQNGSNGSARIHQQMREFAAWAAEDDE